MGRAALTTLAVASVALSACGSPKALTTLTVNQRSQLDFAWSAVINATDTADLTELDRASRARSLYAACRPLDKSNALLSALDDACRPLYLNKKLDAVLPTKCAKPTGVCERALQRDQTATSDLSKALANLNTQAAHVVTDKKCLTELTTTASQINGWSKLSAAYSVMALGAQQGEKDITTLGQHQVEEANTLIGDPRTAAQRMADFRNACGLNDT